MKRFAVFVACILYLLTLTGCGSNFSLPSKEKTAYQNTMTALFTALDEADSETVYNLFAPSVQNQELEVQIDKLLSVYTGPTDEIGWDGLLAGGASYSNGKHIKNSFSTFPIRSGNTYYWCYMDLLYENTYDEQETGITQLDFFTADEYCILKYEELKIADTTGLTVHADDTLEADIRCISGHPHIYSSLTKPLKLEDVTVFFNESNSFSGFKAQFGEPNAENIYCYYELPAEGNEQRYLQLLIDNDEICNATVVNTFEYIETIYDNNASSASKN